MRYCAFLLNYFQSLVCSLYLGHMTIQTSRISRVEWPHVAGVHVEGGWRARAQAPRPICLRKNLGSLPLAVRPRREHEDTSDASLKGVA